ncbi:HNH endonuclease [Bradyrhizobium sp. cf659]|uniref:HNH endonuclease n=1 Tax=Bradyrhizobium sp. cf659 TaxID=1761771 RepID=UPI0008EAD272|nr:HNH endonuclease [Bradyrhizobium sp. cf659]SFH83618.1 HNH endonuclease [Bradyrhizobium sp. cf659]
MTHQKPQLAADRLREILTYDPASGVFIRDGKAVGWARPSDRLVYITVDYRSYLASRLAWLYMTDEWPPRSVSYRDKDPANLRWGNLRLASPKQTAYGRTARNKLGIKGIRETPNGNFRASIHVNDRTLNLGTFTTKEAAAEAYATAAREHFGEFARP